MKIDFENNRLSAKIFFFKFPFGQFLAILFKNTHWKFHITGMKGSKDIVFQNLAIIENSSFEKNTKNYKNGGFSLKPPGFWHYIDTFYLLLCSHKCPECSLWFFLSCYSFFRENIFPCLAAKRKLDVYFSHITSYTQQHRIKQIKYVLNSIYSSIVIK